MNHDELLNHLHDTYGIQNWPSTLEVDAETYGNICDWLFKKLHILQQDSYGVIHLLLGPNQGIMFKHIELILVKK